MLHHMDLHVTCFIITMHILFKDKRYILSLREDELYQDKWLGHH